MGSATSSGWCCRIWSWERVHTAKFKEKQKTQVILSLSSSFLQGVSPSSQQLQSKVSFPSCCPTCSHSTHCSLMHSAKAIALWPRLTALFPSLPSCTAQQHLAWWRHLPLETSSCPGSPVTLLLVPSYLTGWATPPLLLLASL